MSRPASSPSGNLVHSDDTVRFSHLDCIRGCAILLVISVHMTSLVGGGGPLVHLLLTRGGFGVQLFFVASAITLSLRGKLLLNGSTEIAKFGIRRFFRIAPMYYLGIVLYAIITGMQGTGADYTAKNVLANVLFVHGFVPSAIDQIVPGGWSIACEMVFYVMFPLVIRYWGGASGEGRGGYFTLGAIWLAGWFLIIFAFGIEIPRGGYLYLSPMNQVPVFLIGMGYYERYVKWDKKLPFALIAVLLIVPAVLFEVAWHSPRFGAIFLPPMSALIFIAVVDLASRVKNWEWSGLPFLGRISFSCYILHFLWINFFPLKLPANSFIAPFTIQMFVASTLVVVAATVPLAVVTERLIERGGINLGKRLSGHLFGKNKTQRVPA